MAEYCNYLELYPEYYGDPLEALVRAFPEYTQTQLVNLWERFSGLLCAVWLCGYSSYDREQFLFIFRQNGIELPMN
jgi:hypothetical protein